MMKKTPENNGAERLHKLIARAGISSRRAAEDIIAQGRVMVNGIIVKEVGAKADPTTDRISVDGQPLKLSTGSSIVVLLHKPAGVVSTKKDPEGRTTVLHLMPEKYKHLHPIGRLDFDTSGVIFLTDDGDLTHLLTHPSHGVDKVYWARVGGTVTVDTLKRLENGLFLEDGKTAPCRARVRAQTEKNALVQLTLREGKNRQVRRMLDAVGHSAKALRRVKIADFGLDGLLPGEYRVLIDAEVHQLRKAADTKTKLRTKAPVKTKAKAALSAQSAADKNGATSAARVAKLNVSSPNVSTRVSTAKTSTAKTLSAPTPNADAPVKAKRSPQAMPTRTSVALRSAATPRTAPKPDRYSPTDETKTNRRASTRADSSSTDFKAPATRTPRANSISSTRSLQKDESTRSNASRDNASRDNASRGESARGATSRDNASRDEAHPLAQRVSRRFAQNSDDKPFAPELPSRTRRRDASRDTSNSATRKTSFDESAKTGDKIGDAKPFAKTGNKKPDTKASKAKEAQADKYASKARRGARAWGGKTRKRA